MNEFYNFLGALETSDIPTNETSVGSVIIQQSLRNELRKRGVKAFASWLKEVFGERFDIVETKDSIVIVLENEPGDFTISWEIKCSIKSVDYDPFEAAAQWEEQQEQAAAKKAQREAKKAKKESKKVKEAYTDLL